MKIATWVKAARTKAELSQDALAQALGLTKGNISAWEHARHRPKLEQVLTISRVTGFTLPADLSEWSTSPASVGTRRVPLISRGQAAEWAGAVDQSHDAADWLMTDLEHSDSAFALQIEGDSMLPDFRPGDRIIIDPAVEPRPGDFVVFKSDDEVTFRKYRPRTAGVYELMPLNDDFPAIRSDSTDVKIIGTMVEHRKYRRR